MRRIYHFGLVLILTGITGLAQPQPPNPSAQRGVARLSIVNGDVSVQRGDSETRSAGAVNAPLMAGDVVATGHGRTEIQFDAANMARLDSNSEVRLAELTSGRYQLQVGRGNMMFSQVRESRAQVEIDTPQVAIRPKQKGAYRISVFDDGHAEITVRVGQAEIYTPSGTETLDPGKTMMVRGKPSDPEYQMENAIEQDDFDHWNAGRDQELSRSLSRRHVSPDIYGTEDLDANGRWVNTPDYGTVWTPNESPGWAPYQNGQWVWEDYYGWTWIGYEPWGWAPYHYGRWFLQPGIGWCWYPGPAFAPVYWSPALVAFFGFGGGIGFGWFPLAPFEVIHPWWGAGFYGGVGFHGALIANVNVYNTYRNARIAGAVTAVNAHEFANGRFSSTMHVTPEQLRSASLVRGQVPIAPTAASLRFSNRAVTSTARTNFSNTRFFSHNQPAAINRVPFAQQQRSLSQASSHTAGQSTGAWRPAGETAAKGAAAAPAASNASSGWRRFGDSPAGSGSRGVEAPASSGSGWSTPGDRPSTASQPSRSEGGTAGSWQRFPSSGGSSGTRYGSPGYGSPRSLQIAPPIVRERSTSGNSSTKSSSTSSSGHSTNSGSSGSSHSNGGGGHIGGGGGGGGNHGHR